MKNYQVVIIVLVFLALGYFLGERALAMGKSVLPNILGSDTDSSTDISTVTIASGQVDLWCENGKYYKRTTTTVYGSPTLLEITKAEFDVFVAQGITYSGCKVDDNGNITA